MSSAARLARHIDLFDFLSGGRALNGMDQLPCSRAICHKVPGRALPCYLFMSSTAQGYFVSVHLLRACYVYAWVPVSMCMSVGGVRCAWCYRSWCLGRSRCPWRTENATRALRPQCAHHTHTGLHINRHSPQPATHRHIHPHTATHLAVCTLRAHPRMQQSCGHERKHARTHTHISP